MTKQEVIRLKKLIKIFNKNIDAGLKQLADFANGLIRLDPEEVKWINIDITRNVDRRDVAEMRLSF